MGHISGIRKDKFDQLIVSAEAYILSNELNNALSALERAHYLAQPYAFSHARVFKMRNFVETFGQILFVLVGFFGSLFGIVLRPNPGRFLFANSIHPQVPDVLREIVNQ